MPTLSRWNDCRFFLYSADRYEPPHVHVVKGEDEAKVWLGDCSVAINLGFPDLGDVIRKIREELDASWRLGRTILHIEIEDARPVAVQCNDRHLIVTLTDGRVLQTPVWWYPRLLAGTVEQRSQVELSPLGIRWPRLDEDIRVTSILRGVKAPGATEPGKSEATDRR